MIGEYTMVKTTPPSSELVINDGKKLYDLYDIKTGKVIGTFKGKSGLVAAKKAATKGIKDILLREKGSSRPKLASVLFRYSGSRAETQRPMPYPTWLAEKLKVPADQNKKGNEGKYPFKCFISTARRTDYYKVPKVEGRTHMEAVEDFIKTLK